MTAPTIQADTNLLDESERVRLAANNGASFTALQNLALDPAVTVRAAVAMNASASSSLFTVLANDPDDRVRALLGRRLATLLPSLPAEDRAQLREHAVSTLLGLVNDEAERVRLAISDVIKDVPGVPHELIVRLAHDISIAVAEPVIRLSPVLTDQDLLELVAAPPTPASVIAVARRPGLAAMVATSISECSNTEAISALLGNRSAAISEQTLDRLIERAAQHAEWQASLVRRPRLSAHATKALARIVTGQVLNELAERADLPADLAQDLARRIEPTVNNRDIPGQPQDAPTLDQATQMVQEIAKSGQLTEDALIAAARRGEVRLCTALLAASAGVAAEVVDRASRLRSAKGLISLVWRAGFTMRAAGPVQTVLARLPPDSVLPPTEHGDFPLAPEEMRWQVEFLTRIGREGPAFS